jgi:signal peptidase I
MKKRSPVVSGVFALIEPGLGLVYNGKHTAGVTLTFLSWTIQILAIFFGALASFRALAILVCLHLVYKLTIIVRCVYLSIRIKAIPLTPFNRWFVYAAFILIPFVLVQVLDGIKERLPYQSFRMPVAAMEPNIDIGDCFVVDMRYYDHISAKPGDVVVFRAPFNKSAVLVERCVATGGQQVEIRDGILLVDQTPALPSLLTKRLSSQILPRDSIDSFIYPKGAGNNDQYAPMVVPRGTCFVLGDLRDNSVDSRYFGFLRNDDILGKALYVYWSTKCDRIGSEIR